MRASYRIGLACLLAAVSAGGTLQSRTATREMVVGWHDEFNSLEGWAPWTANGGADILTSTDGAMRVRLGKTAMYMDVFKDYRAGVWKDVEVDLNRYPIFAVRSSRFRGAASWDVDVLDYRDRNAADARDISRGGGIPVPGNPEGLAADRLADTGNRYAAETVFTFMPPNPKRQGKRRVRIMVNLSGPKRGGSLDVAWIRFLTIEQGRMLRDSPTASRWQVRSE
jgi:hypothetical protein